MTLHPTPIPATAIGSKPKWRRLLTLLAACLATAAESAEPPAHHGDNGFTNPYSAPRSSGFFKVVASRLFSGQWQSYNPKRDRVPTATPLPTDLPGGNATVTWIGHATVLLQHQGINVLTDPMFSDFASPLSFAGPKRITRPALDIGALPPIHAVVISHNHYDHLDKRSIRALGNEPVYLVPLGLAEWFEDQGIDPERVVEMDWWEQHRLTVDGARQLVVRATPSQHFSGRSLTDRNRTLWAAWSIQWTDFHAWFGGDTGYNDVQFREIGERVGPIDLGIIPIGAYAPREIMGPVHVNPAEAIQIHRDIGAASSMAIHWGAFVLSAEGVMTPATTLTAAREDAGLAEHEFAVFAVGETRHYTP